MLPLEKLLHLLHSIMLTKKKGITEKAIKTHIVLLKV